MQVAVRVRPFINEERTHSLNPAVTVDPAGLITVRIAQSARGENTDTNSIANHRPATPRVDAFQFDKALWSVTPTDTSRVPNVVPTQSQEDVYAAIGAPLLDHAFAGFNSCLFAYGHTGTGKTFTMMGGSGDKRGITPRLCTALFDRKAQREQETGDTWTVAVAFVEIYEEKIFDLLAPGGPCVPEKTGVTLDENLVTVDTAAAMLGHTVTGTRHRHVAVTPMNPRSSRSHTIFQIVLQEQRSLTPVKINLVDLAGCERNSLAAQEKKQTRKEQAYINRSLFSLRRFMEKLAENSKHLPVRDSKLTHLLSDSIGGNSKTCMIATVSPSEKHARATLETLEFASRFVARRIVNTVSATAEPSVHSSDQQRFGTMGDAIPQSHQPSLRELELENQMLRQALIDHCRACRAELDAEMMGACMKVERTRPRTAALPSNADSTAQLAPLRSGEATGPLQGPSAHQSSVSRESTGSTAAPTAQLGGRTVPEWIPCPSAHQPYTGVFSSSARAPTPTPAYSVQRGQASRSASRQSNFSYSTRLGLSPAPDAILADAPFTPTRSVTLSASVAPSTAGPATPSSCIDVSAGRTRQHDRALRQIAHENTVSSANAPTSKMTSRSLSQHHPATPSAVPEWLPYHAHHLSAAPSSARAATPTPACSMQRGQASRSVSRQSTGSSAPPTHRGRQSGAQPTPMSRGCRAGSGHSETPRSRSQCHPTPRDQSRSTDSGGRNPKRPREVIDVDVIDVDDDEDDEDNVHTDSSLCAITALANARLREFQDYRRRQPMKDGAVKRIYNRTLDTQQLLVLFTDPDACTRDKEGLRAWVGVKDGMNAEFTREVRNGRLVPLEATTTIPLPYPGVDYWSVEKLN